MDRINADSLRTFIEVARLEHLGRASETLQQDPSTVSRKIARLEQEVGVPLFERIGRSIRLTQAGKRFVGRAERLLSDLREAVADAEGAVSAESGEVRVGFLHTVGARWLPERLAAFLRAHPGVRFILEEGTTAEVASGVLAGDFDVGILGPPPLNTPDLETVPLFRERVAVVVPLEHRLAGRTSVRLTDIADEPLILPRSRSGLRRVIDDAFASQGLAPRVAYEGDDFSIVQGCPASSTLPRRRPGPSARRTTSTESTSLATSHCVPWWTTRATGVFPSAAGACMRSRSAPPTQASSSRDTSACTPSASGSSISICASSTSIAASSVARRAPRWTRGYRS